MKSWIVIVALALVSHLSLAGTPALEPYKGTGLTVSFPKGWVVAQQQSIYVVQQDPKRKDAADLLFIYTPAGATATEDAMLDAMTAQVAPDFKVSKRAAIPGGGHFAIGDGTVGGIKVRLGAIAIIVAGQAIVGVLVAKTSDFDALGGIALPTQVIASLKLDAPAGAPAAPPPSPAPAPSAPGRPTVADFAGDWQEDANAVQHYANSSGGYAGYSATLTSAHRVFDAKGNFKIAGSYAVASSGGAFGGKVDATGTITITKDNVLVYMQSNWKSPEYYYIRGWDVRPDVTILTLNGHYNSEAEALKAADPHVAINLDRYWVRGARTR